MSLWIDLRFNFFHHFSEKNSLEHKIFKNASKTCKKEHFREQILGTTSLVCIKKKKKKYKRKKWKKEYKIWKNHFCTSSKGHLKKNILSKKNVNWIQMGILSGFRELSTLLKSFSILQQFGFQIKAYTVGSFHSWNKLSRYRNGVLTLQ